MPARRREVFILMKEQGLTYAEAAEQLGLSIGTINTQMLRAMRVHSNFAEYVPLSLLLLYLVEVQGGWPLLVHALGLCLVTGRLAHAYGVSRTNENFNFRIAAMAMTFTVLVTTSLFLLVGHVRSSWL